MGCALRPQHDFVFPSTPFSCAHSYINIVAYPIFAIGEENKERGYVFATMVRV
jgi:hypothetical protein